MDKIISKGVASGSELNFKVENGFLNGLGIFATTGVDDSTITIRYKQGDKPSTFLASKVRLADIMAINDHLYGHRVTNTNNLQAIVKTLVELQTAGTDITALPATLSAWADRNFKSNIMMELGSVPLHNAELDVTIEAKFNGGGTRTISVYRYEEKRSNAELLKYEISKELKSNYSSVSEVYAFTELIDHTLDIEFNVTDFFESRVLDFESAHQMALNRGNLEIVPTDSVAVPVYKALTVIPEEVTIDASGADTSELRLIVIQKIYPENAGVNFRDAEKIRARVATFRQENPQAFQALQNRHPELSR